MNTFFKYRLKADGTLAQMTLSALTLVSLAGANPSFASPRNDARDFQMTDGSGEIDPEQLQPNDPEELDDCSADTGGEPQLLPDEDATKLDVDVHDKLAPNAPSNEAEIMAKRSAL